MSKRAKRVEFTGRNLWMRVRFPPPPPLLGLSKSVASIGLLLFEVAEYRTVEVRAANAKVL